MQITEQDKEYMREAIRLADESVKNGGGPFGAVIVKDGEIIAGRSNSVTIDNDPTAHAEVNTIREACRKLGTFDLSDCVIYTSCEPCPMCLGAIYWARISRIYYGNTKKDDALSILPTTSSTRSWNRVLITVPCPSSLCFATRPSRPSRLGKRKAIRWSIKK